MGGNLSDFTNQSFSAVTNKEQNRDRNMITLSDEQKDSFHREGYLIFENFFEEAEVANYKADIDQLEIDRKERKQILSVLQYPHLGPLVSHPKSMAVVESLMGADFHFHHMHASRQEAGTPGVNWHQDYDQIPQTNRSHLMVHLFYYFDGLNGEVGDLLALPRSQSQIVSNTALWLLEQIDLPGSITLNQLPKGTMVLVHSGLWHARRKKPGGESRPRYFADASYCQAGVRWASYGMPKWREILADARARGLDGDGKYPELLNEARFYDNMTANKLVNSIQGSVITHLDGWKE